MIYIPSNNEIEFDLSIKKSRYKIESRTPLDSNPFSNLETLTFKKIKHDYVLKTIHPLLKTEVFVHNLVDDDPITAAHLLHSKIDEKNKNYYVIMEKIKFQPIYLQPLSDSVNYFHSITEKLANFHLKNANIKFLKKLGIMEYGLPKYKEIINSLGKRIKNLSENVNHENFLDENLIEDFDKYIGSIYNLIEPVASTKQTLVHGDFDTGNILINDSDHKVYAIDFGLSHIDIPVIDIAHLLSATEMSINIRRDIFETYFSIAGKLFPSDMSLQDVRNAGRVMHMLFFLDWYVLTIENKIVPHNYFLEQIHNRVSLLTDLLKNTHD